ncbi:MAG: helix-turn-helix transcriptional regulator [Lachnospiraceae bacterium]|nr:helix-turn-helix transcriptional regulator [Lachnospiraceae bacterium]
MRIEKLLEERKLSLYELAERSGLSYSMVHNLIKGKTDIRKCSVNTAERIARALKISIEDLIFMCNPRYTFTWFRSEQCHLVHRMGELEYMINVLENKEIDHYWHLCMYAEALYELAMVDYISRRNDLPYCEEYNEMRSYKLDRVSYPIDSVIIDEMENSTKERDKLEKGAISEFRRHNIVEGEVFDDER